MKMENKIVIAISFLALSVVFCGGFIGYAILNNGDYIGTGVANGMNTLAQSTTDSTATKHGDVLTISETASYLRVSEGDLSVLVENSSIPCYKVNGETMFSKTALLKWIENSAENRSNY